MATRTAIRNIDTITDIADMPYEVAEGFLKHCRDPKQLRVLEINCPHIADADADLWKSFIARDITDSKKKMIEPTNPRSWWKVYRKLMRDQELLLAAQEDALRKSLVSASVSKSEHSANFVPTVVPFSGTITDARVCADARQRARTANNGGRPWQTSSKNTLSAVGNIRRQTAEAARNRAMVPNVGSSSAVKLAAAKQQIKGVPTSMMNAAHRIQPRKLLPHEQAIMADHQRNSNNNVVIRAPRTGPRNGTKSAAALAIADAEELKRRTNETKLRALTTPAPKAKAKFEYENVEENLGRLKKQAELKNSSSAKGEISPQEKLTAAKHEFLTRKWEALSREEQHKVEKAPQGMRSWELAAVRDYHKETKEARVAAVPRMFGAEWMATRASGATPDAQPTSLKRKRPVADVFMAKKHQR